VLIGSVDARTPADAATQIGTHSSVISGLTRDGRAAASTFTFSLLPFACIIETGPGGGTVDAPDLKSVAS
jgi:hypothetical protein